MRSFVRTAPLVLIGLHAPVPESNVLHQGSHDRYRSLRDRYRSLRHPRAATECQDDGIEQGLTPCGGCIVLHTATQGSFQKLSYDR